jgi:adenylyltransferase/sulfurtransferase
VEAYGATAWERQRVLVVGVGGLGCPATLALARSGVRELTLVDPERVELTNLHRQLWHKDSDLGALKVASAAEKLEAAFPGLRVRRVPERLTEENAEGLFREHDWVLDGVDSVATKLLLSDVGVRTQRPVAYGGVVGLGGQAMLIRPRGPCLRCVFEEPGGDGEGPSCASAGVLGPVAGVVGALQVRLAQTEPRGSTAAKLVVVDGVELTSREVQVQRNPSCLCGEAP